uniref:Uncharacterized protein n=1 Tax=Anopheles coluzzii TaxID=1518534 RepID=A0A8W7Q2F1_ANOCL
MDVGMQGNDSFLGRIWGAVKEESFMRNCRIVSLPARNTHLCSGSRFSSAISSSSRRFATSHSNRSRSADTSFSFSRSQWFSISSSWADTYSPAPIAGPGCPSGCIGAACIECADSELASCTAGLIASTRLPMLWEGSTALGDTAVGIPFVGGGASGDTTAGAATHSLSHMVARRRLAFFKLIR